MSYRGTGLAFVNPDHPQPFAVCDRCGAWRNHDELTWQYDYRGNQLMNLRLLVCKETERCNDRPFEFNRPIIIPPDPYPVKDPRPEFFALAQTPGGIGIDFTIGVSAIGYPLPQTAQNLIQADEEDEFG